VRRDDTKGKVHGFNAEGDTKGDAMLVAKVDAMLGDDTKNTKGHAMLIASSFGGESSGGGEHDTTFEASPPNGCIEHDTTVETGPPNGWIL